MPRKVTKYLCNFKCGVNSMQSAEKAIKHENNCWKNPINKTCSTCSNEIYERDSEDYATWHCRGCKIKEMDAFIESISEDLLIKSSTIGHLKPLWACPLHNHEVYNVDAKSYTDLILGKIKANKTEAESQSKDFLLF